MNLKEIVQIMNHSNINKDIYLDYGKDLIKWVIVNLRPLSVAIVGFAAWWARRGSTYPRMPCPHGDFPDGSARYEDEK